MPANNGDDSTWRDNLIKIIESEEKISDRYIDIRRIDPIAGHGVFSLVFTATDIKSKKQKRVVLKFFNPSKQEEKDRYDRFHRESDFLKDLQRQRNILPLIQEKTSITLLLERKDLKIPLSLIFYVSHLARFDIHDYIYETEKSDLLTNILFFREMCKAVQRLHKNRICHRDLKPRNFFVFGKRYVCLGDFGAARYFNKKYIPLSVSYFKPVGDLNYTAPELLGGLDFSEPCNYCAEIYSLGAILFELFTKTVLSSNIFRGNELLELPAHFYMIPEKERKNLFDDFIGGFARERDLPSVLLFGDSIPKSVATEVDRLYKSMVALDYRKRMTNFETIFLRIDICKKIIQHALRSKKN